MKTAIQQTTMSRLVLLSTLASAIALLFMFMLFQITFEFRHLVDDAQQQRICSSGL